MVQVQPWIPYSKHFVMCLRLVVNTVQYMVQPWVFHDGSLPRDAFSQIEVFMDDGFCPIFLVGNSTNQDRVIHDMFLGSRESLLGVYFGSSLVFINECGFGPYEVQSWLGLIKMLGSDQICLRLIS
jgi:hypothetical protein